MDENKPVLCLDFDGVLHSYASGWQGANNIPDVPVEGAQKFCERALEKFQLVIHSSRCHQQGGIEAIESWLDTNGFPYGIRVVKDKPAAHVSLDDRAITFTGVWPDIEELAVFRPWNKRK